VITPAEGVQVAFRRSHECGFDFYRDHPHLIWISGFRCDCHDYIQQGHDDPAMRYTEPIEVLMPDGQLDFRMAMADHQGLHAEMLNKRISAGRRAGLHDRNNIKTYTCTP